MASTVTELMMRRMGAKSSSVDWEQIFVDTVQGTTINELRFPDGITEIKSYLYYIGNIVRCIIPASVTTIGNYALRPTNLVCIFEGTRPPVINYNSTFRNDSVTIYVPDDAVDTYKASTYFRNLIDRIHPISDLVE